MSEKKNDKKWEKLQVSNHNVKKIGGETIQHYMYRQVS